MGPVFGLLSFLPAIPLYLWTEEPFWALIIVVGAIVNLFNLIPMTPLDGGRIVAGISTKLWGLGLIMLLAYAIWTMSFVAFFILIVGTMSLFRIRSEQKNVENERKRVKDYQDMLATLKNIVATSSYEHLQYFAQSLRPNLKDESSLYETIDLLDESETEEEEKEKSREQKKVQFIEAFEQEVTRIHTYVEETAAYYKTDRKTKTKLFLIYLGLIIVLGTFSYFSFELLPPLEK